MGLSGRKLKVPVDLKNPSGNFSLGLKAVFDLCSTQLRDRFRKERKEKLWQPFNEEALFQIQGKLNDLGNQAKQQAIKPIKDLADSCNVTSTVEDLSLTKSNDLNEVLNK